MSVHLIFATDGVARLREVGEAPYLSKAVPKNARERVNVVNLGSDPVLVATGTYPNPYSLHSLPATSAGMLVLPGASEAIHARVGDHIGVCPLMGLAEAADSSDPTKPYVGAGRSIVWPELSPSYAYIQGKKRRAAAEVDSDIEDEDE